MATQQWELPPEWEASFELVSAACMPYEGVSENQGLGFRV